VNEWRPGASRHALETRAALLESIRAFFGERGVLEVETPVLSRYANTDPHIDSIGSDDHPSRYLRTSPEFPMKRLLCAGMRNIYELGRVFRAGESGARHNPEFTMLEWYRAGMPYLELADEVVDLVRHCSPSPFADWPLRRVAYRKLFHEQTGLDPWVCREEDLADCAADRGISADALDHQAWQHLLMAEVIQPSLAGERLTIVHDYPPEQAALARIRADDPPVAERFEVYVGEQELANGYQELTDPDEQMKRFRKESRERTARGERALPVDSALISAMRDGMPECSGVALGVDRLLMSILKLERIDSVLAFSWERA
jgi:lysyl-tRNA synthetase class 2